MIWLGGLKSTPHSSMEQPRKANRSIPAERTCLIIGPSAPGRPPLGGLSAFYVVPNLRRNRNPASSV